MRSANSVFLSFKLNQKKVDLQIHLFDCWGVLLIRLIFMHKRMLTYLILVVNFALIGPAPSFSQEANDENSLAKIIYVPGILGSKIYKLSDGEASEAGNIAGVEAVNSRIALWGEEENAVVVRNLVYRVADRAKIKTEIFDELSLFDFIKDVQGQSIRYLRNLNPNEDDDFLAFHYDWRQDNRLSATSLRDFICMSDKKIDGENLLFVAHSMGGLVTRYFMKKYMNSDTLEIACTEDKVVKPATVQVIFLGVPHYGTPSSLTTLLSGFEVFEGEGNNVERHSFFSFVLDKAISRVVRVAENNFKEAINNAGYSFPSVYQLLPIYSFSNVARSRSVL